MLTVNLVKNLTTGLAKSLVAKTSGIIGAVSNILFHDDYITDESDPITSPRVAEPGPGNSVLQNVTDATENITGEHLVLTLPTVSQSYNNLYLQSDEEFDTVTPGIVFGCLWEVTNRRDGVQFAVILDNGSGGTNVRFASAGAVQTLINSGHHNVDSSWQLEEQYTALIFDGVNWIIAVKADTPYPSFTLLYPLGAATDLLDDRNLKSRPRLAIFNSGPTEIDHLKVVDRSSAWSNYMANAADVIELATTNQAFSAPADSWIVIDWIPQTGENLDVRFRRTDDNDCLLLELTEGFTGNINLSRVVSGTPTSIGTATDDMRADVPVRIMIRCIGSNVQVHYMEDGGPYSVVHNVTETAHQAVATGGTIVTDQTEVGFKISTHNVTLSGNDAENIAPTSPRAIPTNNNLFIWITDMHVHSGNSDRLNGAQTRAIAAYLNSLGPAGLINTGDNGEGFGVSADYQDFKDYFFDLLNMPAGHLRGNHDEDFDYTDSGSPTSFTAYDAILSHPYRTTIDWAEAKVRFILAHCEDIHQPEADFGFFTLGEQQDDATEQAWIEARVADRPSGYKVIICTHARLLDAPGANIKRAGQTNLLAYIAANKDIVRGYLAGHRHANNSVYTQDDVTHIVGIHGWGTPDGGILDGGFNVLEYDSVNEKILVHAHASKNFFSREGRVPAEISLADLVYSFNGTSEYVSFGNVLGMVDATTTFDISFKTKYLTASNFDFVSKMLSTGTLAGWGIASFTGKIRVYVINDWGGLNRLAVETAQTFNNNREQTIRVTYDGSGSASGIKIYVDGLSVRKDPIASGDNLSGSPASSANLSVAARNGTTSSMMLGSVWSLDATVGGTQIACNGYGPVTPDWDDTVGANDGVVTGTPSTIAVDIDPPLNPGIQDSQDNVILDSRDDAI